MTNELAQEIFALIEARSTARPTTMEFEMAYQTRVAIDRIRFGIKHTEEFGPHTDQIRHTGFQLLNALHRLEAVDRRFQARCGPALTTEDGEQRILREDNGSQFRFSAK
jgi:hypothetical protein